MQINCQHCGKPFNISPSRIGIIKFCSKECRSNNYQARKSTIRCSYCGKDFEVYNHELPRKKYCSKQCQNSSMETDNVLICDICGRSYKRVPSRIIASGNFCSHTCASINLQRRETKYCTICGNPVTRPVSLIGDRVLCSSQCKSIYYSRLYTGQNHPNYNSVLRNCLVCGKEFNEPKSRVAIGKGKFCSKECKYQYFSAFYQEANNPHWQGGSSFYRGLNWGQQRKKALIRDNFTCQICGKMENIQVHHITPYKLFNDDYVEANKLSNLKTVCRSCHLSIEPRIPISREMTD